MQKQEKKNASANGEAHTGPEDNSSSHLDSTVKQSESPDKQSEPPGEQRASLVGKAFEVGSHAPNKSPFADLRSLRIAQSFDQGSPLRERILEVPIRNPGAQDFFRCSAKDALETLLIEEKPEGTYYLLMPNLWQEWGHEATARIVVPYMTRRGALALWALRAPSPDGRVDQWAQVSLEVLELAKTHWVRRSWDAGQRRHRVYVADGLTDEPRWPDLTFEQMLELAFGERVISTPDHPLLRQLKGLE